MIDNKNTIKKLAYLIYKLKKCYKTRCYCKFFKKIIRN